MYMYSLNLLHTLILYIESLCLNVLTLEYYTRQTAHFLDIFHLSLLLFMLYYFLLFILTIESKARIEQNISVSSNSTQNSISVKNFISAYLFLFN